MVVEGQFSPSCLHPNMGLLPGRIVPLFMEITGLHKTFYGHFLHGCIL